MHFDSRYKDKCKSRIAAAVLLAALMGIGLTACSLPGKSGTDGSSVGAENISDVTVEDLAAEEMFTDRDLSGDYDEADAEKIKLSDEDVTISEEGVYILSGSLRNGQITVNADESAKVQIVLDGIEIENESEAAIYVKSANKVFVTLAEGSENTLKVTGEYGSNEEDNVDSVIFSKADLTINGTGSLIINGEYGHGIVSKDDLVFTGGEYNVTAEKKAIDANNSVRIADGTFALTAGTDGIHAADTDKNVGFVYIADGNFTIKAGDDAVHAYTDFVMDGGSMTAAGCYEGLEGNTVIINGGEIDITAEDDALNAAGGDGSGDLSGGDDMFASDDSAVIQINGGDIHADAGGDGLDSNGSVEINGGTTTVEGPENDGNGIIDTGGSGSAVITGGTFIATGSSGMAVNFSEESAQGAIMATVGSTTGTAELKDADGNVLASTDTDKQYSCVQVSTPDVKKGETYTLTAGGADTVIKMDSMIYGKPGGTGPGSGGSKPGSDGSSGGRPPQGGKPEEQTGGN